MQNHSLTDRQVVPAPLQTALYALLVVGAALSLPKIGQFTPLPMTALLDGWVILFIGAMFLRGRTAAVGLVEIGRAHV